MTTMFDGKKLIHFPNELLEWYRSIDITHWISGGPTSHCCAKLNHYYHSVSRVHAPYAIFHFKSWNWRLGEWSTSTQGTFVNSKYTTRWRSSWIGNVPKWVYLCMHIWIKHWFGQKTTAQYGKHIQVQFPEEQPVLANRHSGFICLAVPFVFVWRSSLGFLYGCVLCCISIRFIWVIFLVCGCFFGTENGKTKKMIWDMIKWNESMSLILIFSYRLQEVINFYVVHIHISLQPHVWFCHQLWIKLQ